MTPRNACAATLPLILAALISTIAPLAASEAHAQDEIAPIADPGLLFETGVELYRSGQYALAIEVFRQVFELDPNPFVLFNIGRCHEELGQLKEAVRYYKQALLLDGLTLEAKAEAIKRLDVLEPQLDALDAEQSALQKAQAGREMIAMILRLAKARAAERASAEVLALRAAEDERRRALAEIKPPELPTEPPPGRGGLSWTGIAVGAAGGGALAAGLLVMTGADDDLERQQDLKASYDALRADALSADDPDKARAAIGVAGDINELADDIERQQGTSAALLISGGALVAVGALLLMLDTPDDDPSAKGDGLTLILMPGALGFSGQF